MRKYFFAEIADYQTNYSAFCKVSQRENFTKPKRCIFAVRLVPMPPAPASTRTKLLKRFQKLEPGKVVSYASLQRLGPSPGAVAAALTRLVQEGALERVAKGSYRLPLNGRFGKRPITDQQALQVLLKKTGKPLSGYPTGTAAFNRLGLTTQVPREITIATPRPKRPQQVGNVQVRYVKSAGQVRANEINVRQLLDALQQLKRLPDTDPKKALRQLRTSIKALPPTERQQLARLALRYNPGTRALAGAVLEALGDEKMTRKLFRSLNPVTVYRFGDIGLTQVIRNKWRIQ